MTMHDSSFVRSGPVMAVHGEQVSSYLVVSGVFLNIADADTLVSMDGNGRLAGFPIAVETAGLL